MILLGTEYFTLEGLYSNGVVNVSGGSTSNTTLNDLEKGKMYNISIVGTSEHLFSQSVWRAVELSG